MCKRWEGTRIKKKRFVYLRCFRREKIQDEMINRTESEIVHACSTGTKGQGDKRTDRQTGVKREK